MLKKICLILTFVICCSGSRSSRSTVEPVISYNVAEVAEPKLLAMAFKEDSLSLRLSVSSINDQSLQDELDHNETNDELAHKINELIQQGDTICSYNLIAVNQLWQKIATAVTQKEKEAIKLNRLWLQSYNAGPGALLKYRGNVPYRETRAYVKNVTNYYNQDLSNNPYDAQIRDAAKKFNLDPQMVRAIAKAESDFNPRCVSHAGARGVMQVMGCTWLHAKKVANIPWSYGKDVFDPEKNIYVACAYLSWLRHDFIPQNMTKLNAPPKESIKVADSTAKKKIRRRSRRRS